MKIVDGLKDRLRQGDFLGLKVFGKRAVVRSDRFLAQFSLERGETNWVVDHESVRPLRRRAIQLSGQEELLWFNGQIVAELIQARGGAATIEVRDSTTGRLIWDHLIPRPAIPPAEIHGFIVDDPNFLVVFLASDTRVSVAISPTGRVTTTTPLRYQTNAIRFDPATGRVLWHEEFDDLAIEVIAQGSFSGLWAWRSRLGVIDLETGTNTILRQSPHSLGWPIRDGGNIVVPWFARNEVGVEWMDEQGRQVRAGQWPEPRVREITLHPTDDGLGVQTNSQSFWWLGREATPIWNVRAKPYIYRVYRATDSDVFIGTDGMGGRLLAFDPNSGQETRNIKPKSGGFGDLTRIPGRPLLASTFTINRTYPLQCRLFAINMLDHQHILRDEPSSVLGTWDGGVVGLTGRTWEHLAVFDIPRRQSALN